jgi:hypothetical protein
MGFMGFMGLMGFMGFEVFRYAKLTPSHQKTKTQNQKHKKSAAGADTAPAAQILLRAR